jgi:EAL domain-containing protein (putative c-di-GMP-specific phosphodiesterase class I)
VSPERFSVELTETSLLHDSGMVEQAVDELVDLGVHVGIDDFGTGYSALAYLPRFPLRFLKIDMSFVQRLGTSRRSDAVVAAVVALAHAHDMTVVAEGVETPAQADALRAMGCEHGQGWLFGRPAPVDLG